MLDKIKSAWASFEAWVYSWMPGFKTFIVTGLGFLGSSAAVAQTYITQLPLEKFATATQIAIGAMTVSLLALWFNNMGPRVASRVEATPDTTID